MGRTAGERGPLPITRPFFAGLSVTAITLLVLSSADRLLAGAAV